MTETEGFSREQELLAKLRNEKCGGNAAELARRLGKDASYVNRLFYPAGKKGGKGIGLEVMRAASEAFKLPRGFWEGADGSATAQGELPLPPSEENMQHAMETADRSIEAAIDLLTAVLQNVDTDGRDLVALTLSQFAKAPESVRDRAVMVLTAAARTTPAHPPPSPQRKKVQRSKAATRAVGKASLVLKVGGDQKQMFAIPTPALTEIMGDHQASQREQDWYKTLKSAPKVKRSGG